MQAHTRVARPLLAGLALACLAPSSLAQEVTLFAQFERQTPAAFPTRYALPAVTADLDGLGYGCPPGGGGPPAACSTPVGTNPDEVRVVLTDLFDDQLERRSTFAPGTRVAILDEHTVTIRVTGGAIHGTDYELFVLDTDTTFSTVPCPTGRPVTLGPIPGGGMGFSFTVPGSASFTAPERTIQVRYLVNAAAPPLQTATLTIAGVCSGPLPCLNSPATNPALFVGANDAVVLFMEENSDSASPLPGDECGAATDIAGTGRFYFDTRCATLSSPITCGDSPDVWLRWTAPAAGSYSFDTYGAGFNTALEVYDDACPTPASIACNDNLDATTLESRVCFDATASTAYLVRVGGSTVGGGDTGGAGFVTVRKLASCASTTPPFVVLGHATTATKTDEDQVSTKMARVHHVANSDHFGIRFMDKNLNVDGAVGGNPIPYEHEFYIHGMITSAGTPGTHFELYTDRLLQLPVVWTSALEFRIPVTFTDPVCQHPASPAPPLTCSGASLWVKVLAAPGPGATSEIAFELTDVTPIATGPPPLLGWNVKGRWLVIN